MTWYGVILAFSESSEGTGNQLKAETIVVNIFFGTINYERTKAKKADFEFEMDEL